jgi:hypothetical protein
MPFYEKGKVRIHYEEAGSGFPLLVIAGGGQNSTVAWAQKNAPFNPIDEFRNEYRVITADLRNAPSGQSTGPLEIERDAGLVCRRSPRAHGSSRREAVHGAGFLHRRPVKNRKSESRSQCARFARS